MTKFVLKDRTLIYKNNQLIGLPLSLPLQGYRGRLNTRQTTAAEVEYGLKLANIEHKIIGEVSADDSSDTKPGEIY